LVDSSTNYTNEDDLYYFAHLTNHYLHLVKTSPSMLVTSRHKMKFPIITDSGANYHVFKDREFFESLHPASGQVILGDGKTALSIKGIGTIRCKIGTNILTIEGVCYIPDLAESIYSLFLHIQHPLHGLHSSFEDGLYIIFPHFQTKAILGADNIYLDAVPANLDETSQTIIDNPSSASDPACANTTDEFCRNVKQFQMEVF
jgi:hypothetical protein